MQHEFIAQCIASANIANAQGQYSVAVGWCQQAIRRASKSPEAWYNLGIAYHGLGRFEQSLAALKQASSMVRDNADAQNSIGLQFLELGALQEAEQCLRRAISLAPNFAFAHSNLGMLNEKKGRLEEAELSFRKAIDIQPDLAPVYINLSAVLNRQKKYECAEAAAGKALEIDSSASEAWNNLGAALSGQKRYGEAEAAARKSLEIDAKSIATWRNLGDALLDQEKYQDAISCFVESIRLDPDGARVLGASWSGDASRARSGVAGDRVLGGLLSAKMHICDWSGFAEMLDAVVLQAANGELVISPYSLLALTDDPAMHRQVAARHAQDRAPERGDLGLAIRPARAERVRIGYYSADFHNHATMYLMAELFELHDKNEFELIGFSFGPDVQDEMRVRVTAAFDRFFDVCDHSDKEVAKLSRDLGIDIAIDLKGYTKDSRPGIFAFRAAPIQVNYLGYPGTMAVSYMDYIIADTVLIPEGSQAFYDERVVYLPDCYQVNDAHRPISAAEFTRAHLGLPASGFIFACFNNNHKITPPVFDGWMRILKRVPGAVLWLFEANPEASANLRKEALARGVDADRLVFAKRMSHPEHLARIGLADLFLDTLPYNAHTTTSDALWAGLPVLTCVGRSFAARVAASLLSAIGLHELITTSQQDYEDLAVELAKTPDRLRVIKDKLARNRLVASLFDSKKFTAQLEMAYRAMYGRFHAGLSPEPISLAQDGPATE